MKVTIEELEQCEVLMTVEIEAAREQDLLKKAAKRISRQVRIPGFRPGKAPYNTVIRRFGLEAIQQEVLEDAVEKIVEDALTEADLKPYAQVQLDEVSWGPLMLKVKVPGPPKVELGNYREIRLEVEPVEVSDDAVDEALHELQEQNAAWVPVERPAEVGDLISMTVVEKDGEKVLAEHEAVEYELTLPADDEEEKSQPDLTTPLLGLSAGDEKTFPINYPEEYSDERYAGREITFIVDVSSVKVKELDPLDDEFAQSMGDFETLAQLREQMHANLEQRQENQYNHELGHEMVEKMVESAEKIEWPQALEDLSIDQELENYESQLKQSGLTLDDYLAMQNKTRVALREEIQERVVTRLKRSLVLSEVAKLEDLTVSNSEILEQAKSIADVVGGGDQLWQNILASESHQNNIANDLLTDKVLLRLATIAKGEAPEPGETGPDEATNDEVQAPVSEDEEDNESATSDEVTDDASRDTVAGDGSEVESTEEVVTTKA